MKTFLLLTIVLAGTIVSCSKEEADIFIRIENASNYSMKNIKVISFGKEYLYEDLAPSTSSDYMLVERAYSYAYIEVDIDGLPYILQPIDFFGETELLEGKYTYILDADDSMEKYGRLSLRFRED